MRSSIYVQNYSNLLQTYLHGKVVTKFLCYSFSSIDRKTAMKQLIHLLPTNSLDISENSLKTILTTLLATSGRGDVRDIYLSIV